MSFKRFEQSNHGCTDMHISPGLAKITLAFTVSESPTHHGSMSCSFIHWEWGVGRMEEVSRSSCVGPRSDSSTLNAPRSIRSFFMSCSAITSPASNFSSFFLLHCPIALADKRHAGPFLLVGPRQTAFLFMAHRPPANQTKS